MIEQIITLLHIKPITRKKIRHLVIQRRPYRLNRNHLDHTESRQTDMFMKDMTDRR